jgi:hypothetical protein
MYTAMKPAIIVYEKMKSHQGMVLGTFRSCHINKSSPVSSPVDPHTPVEPIAYSTHRLSNDADRQRNSPFSPQVSCGTSA